MAAARKRSARKPSTRASKAVRRSPAKDPSERPAAPRRQPAGASGPRRMKAYASFDLYLADQPAKQQRLIRSLRRLVARTAPALQEAVKWSNGCWLSGKAPIAYVYAADDHVQFGFTNGAALDDPQGLLRGSGKHLRHVRLAKPGDIDERALAALLRQAVALGHPAFGT